MTNPSHTVAVRVRGDSGPGKELSGSPKLKHMERF